MTKTLPDGVIYFLDDKKYPHSELALSYLINRDFDIEILEYSKDRELLFEKLRQNTSSSFYTIRPEVYNEIKSNVPLSKSFINAADDKYLQKVKDRLNNIEYLFIDKMKLNSNNLDPITLSKIFTDSPIKSVKLQTNGTPVIIGYEGLDTFNYINAFNSGIITPATQSELNCTTTDSRLPNQDYIYQKLPGLKEGVFLCITEWENNDLKWYEITKLDLPKELIPLENESIDSHAYFLYLKKLNTYKVSAIFSGINYHVNPSYYL